jgi:hypothetical protein
MSEKQEKTMWTKLRSLVLAVLVTTSFIGLALAQSNLPTQHVKFSKGSSSATVKGVIKGDVPRDYVLGAHAGQTMSVKLATKSNLYFNVLPPGSEEALFVGSMETDGTTWSGELPTEGDYRIRVYAMGAAKKGNHPFTCTISIK